MLGPLSLSVALLLHPPEPHAAVRIQVEPERGYQPEWAACWYYAALIRAESPPGFRMRLRMVYITPRLLEISLPTQDDPDAATKVNAIADIAITKALPRWTKALEMTIAGIRYDIPEHRRKAEYWRKEAEDNPDKREKYLEQMTYHLDSIPRCEVQLDRMERSLAQGLPRAKIIQRAKP